MLLESGMNEPAVRIESLSRPDYVINGAATTEAPSGASFVFPSQ
jgi:hypothetical protein